MKIISWNVNGIRAVAKKGLKNFLKKENPDILCLQETKISDAARAQHEFSAKGGSASGGDFAGYEEYWNSAERPGYSGTAVLIKSSPPAPLLIRRGVPKAGRGAINGIGAKEFDDEGRVQTMDAGKFYLVNAYFPNANHELSRLDYKFKFNDALFKYLKKLEKKKPVVICGDFNVAHEEIDIARPKDNEGNAGFTPEERAWMTKFLNSGFIDTFREKNPKKVQYSWWSYRFNARVRNIGWRIDYFCVSKKFFKNIKKAYILDKVKGSDHCPIVIEM
ncbi:MAG: exodeoxyribonuclease III [Patescibacteria group bacterium]|nr:exodeoxyribonuclease III [Patescibacteria group bacterium]MDD4610756.1 exodeoxyribonuclease III [Patescibacteria group bacterium]